jgi:hypothetical protein
MRKRLMRDSGSLAVEVGSSANDGSAEANRRQIASRAIVVEGWKIGRDTAYLSIDIAENRWDSTSLPEFRLKRLAVLD